MAFVIKLTLVALLCAVQIMVSVQQDPQEPGQMKIYSFCDLSQTDQFVDPAIISEEAAQAMGRNVYPAAAVARELSRSPERQAFVRGVEQSQARNTIAASQGRAELKRKKRAVGSRFMAPTRTSGICSVTQKRILFSLHSGDFCYVVQPQVLNYYDCSGQTQCNVDNQFTFYHAYRCESETYVYLPAMVYCQNPPYLREQVFYVGINCCCKKYWCDLPNRFDTPRVA